MSDIFLSSGVGVDIHAIERAMTFTDCTRVQSGHAAGMAWAVGRVDDWGIWGPAWDPASQTRLLLGGRIALEEADWSAAERLPYEGGLAARWLLAQWLDLGAAGISSFNGAALAVVLDERAHTAHLWTDRMGFYPAFVSDERGVIVSSHPDLIARALTAAGRPPKVDHVTIAELLRTGTSVHPHTYWREVRQLDAGSAYTISAADEFRSNGAYWRPAYVDQAPPLERNAFIEAFSDALRAAGRRRSLSRLGKTVVLLSSGADSRGVLCATNAPDQVDCYTYYDEPNMELEGAQRIAGLTHARHASLQRPRDYYVQHAESTVALSGGMWGIESGHHAGFAAEIREQSQPGTVLTGCYCDYLFKGLGLNRRHAQIMGRNLPLYVAQPYSHQFYQPFSWIDPDWASRVDERFNARFPSEIRDGDPRLAEYARLSPISREADASGRLTLWKTLPFDVIVADSDVLDAYGRLSVADKLSGIAFGKAVARVTGRRIASVVNSNFGAPVGSGELGRVSAFVLASLARKARRAMGGAPPVDQASVATLGSWPNLTRVALHSSIMRNWFHDFTRPNEILWQMLHPVCRAWSFEEFARRDVFLLYRIITAGLWMKRAADITAAVPVSLGEAASS